MAIERCRLDTHRNRGSTSRSLERIREPPVEEQRRVDALRELPHAVESLANVRAHLFEERLGGRRVGVREL